MTPEACRRSLGNLRDVAGDIPILAITGRRLDAEVPPHAFGVDDVLGKPFDVDEVLQRVRALLDRPMSKAS
jgi:DNA-binding response OmpR family regulator